MENLSEILTEETLDSGNEEIIFLLQQIADEQAIQSQHLNNISAYTGLIFASMVVLVTFRLLISFFRMVFSDSKTL